jgi:predicted GIY-YIG superfamily endonuclease
VWYVYFLKPANEAVHVGSTNDLERRIDQHKSGYVISTKPCRPVTLRSYIAIEMKPTRANSSGYFKSGSGKAFALKRLIKLNE